MAFCLDLSILLILLFLIKKKIKNGTSTFLCCTLNYLIYDLSVRSSIQTYFLHVGFEWIKKAENRNKCHIW